MLLKGMAAAVTWTAVVMVAIRWARAPTEKRKLTATACWALVALAAAFTIWLPPVSGGLDRATRVPNLAQWLWNGCVLVTGYFVDEFLDILEQGVPGSKRRRWGRRAVLVAALCLMAVFLWRAGLRRDVADFTPGALGSIPPPPLVAYQLVYALTFSIIVWRLLFFAGRDALASRDVIVKVGTSLTTVGAAAALVYFAARMPLLLLMPQSRLSIALVGIEQFSMVVAALGTVCGASCPVWGRYTRLRRIVHHVQAALTIWRLRGLWQTLTAAAPGTVLPTATTLVSALLRPQDMDLLLYRRVIEILDARRVVLNSVAVTTTYENVTRDSRTPASSLRLFPGISRRLHEGTGRQPEGDAAATPAGQMRNAARAEARLLALALNKRPPITQQHPRQPSHANTAPLYQAATFHEQVRYLRQLAVELRRVEDQSQPAPVTRLRTRT